MKGKLADMQRIFSLNPVAEHIWNQLDGKKSLQEISDSLLSHFDADKKQVDEDIQEFVDELLKQKLITNTNDV